MKLNSIINLVAWGYITYSVLALLFYFSKIFFDILVPVHLVATIPVFILFYSWRKNIYTEGDDRRCMIVSRFLVPIAGIYLVMYFFMFSKMV